MRRVIRIVQDQRDERYSLLRGYFHGSDDDTVDELEHERLSTVTLTRDSRSRGRAASELALEGVRIVSRRGPDGKAVDAAADTPLADGDTLVLSGRPEALAIATEKLLRG
jgi:CPA2 family monovalent cation:H+ antiporter-2